MFLAAISHIILTSLQQTFEFIKHKVEIPHTRVEETLSKVDKKSSSFQEEAPLLGETTCFFQSPPLYARSSDAKTKLIYYSE